MGARGGMKGGGVGWLVVMGRGGTVHCAYRFNVIKCRVVPALH